jgi:hypothetical protein
MLQILDFMLNDSDAEDTGTPNAIDIVSNGFKIRTNEGQ